MSLPSPEDYKYYRGTRQEILDEMPHTNPDNVPKATGNQLPRDWLAAGWKMKALVCSLGEQRSYTEKYLI